MHLDQAQIAHHQHAVANAVEAAAEGIDVLLQNIGIQILDQELRAIGKLDFADRVVVIFKGGGPVSGQLQLFGGYFLAPQAGGIAHVDEQKSAPAGIHHAGLGQRGQHLLRLFEDGVAGGQNVGKQRVVILRGTLGLLDRLLGDNARHGEDGAFLGLHDRLIGRFRAALERLGELHGRDPFDALQRARKAAVELRGDHAAVAARAAQRALGKRGGRLARAEVFLLIDLLGGGGHGQAHIGARITVRHGKNVQGIHRFTVLFQQGRAGHHHIAQQHAVNRLGLYQRFFLLTR